MSKYSHFLNKTNSSWRPEYVRNQTNFANKITAYRSNWKAATTKAIRNSIESNFKRNYTTWLTRVKKENVARRRNEQKLLNSLRTVKNKSSVSKLLKQYNNSHSAPAYAPPSPRAKGKKPQSLMKSMHAARLVKMKSNLKEKIRNLEARRNNLERQISLVVNELRSLPY
jgi:hypothetical protein